MNFTSAAGGGGGGSSRRDGGGSRGRWPRNSGRGGGGRGGSSRGGRGGGQQPRNQGNQQRRRQQPFRSHQSKLTQRVYTRIPPPTHQSSVESNNSSIRIVSYNVLSQHLLNQHHHLYRRTPRYMLEWEFRFNNLREEIAAARPTILCLQELQFDHLASHFIPALRHLGMELASYKCRGMKDVNDDTQHEPQSDGCAIFYDATKVTKLLDQPLSLYVHHHPLLGSRKNVAVIGCFRTNNAKEPRTFVCTTTHLVFNPKRGDVKLAQSQLVLNATRDMVSAVAQSFGLDPNTIPVIVCGDFNSTPGSVVMSMCKKGTVSLPSNEFHTASGQWRYQDRACRTVRRRTCEV